MTDQEFISHKIGILIKEGYPKDQAAAISYTMLKDKKHMQKAQEGAWYQNNNPFFTNNPGQQYPQNMYQQPKVDYNKQYMSMTEEEEQLQPLDDPKKQAYNDYLKLKIANPYWGVDPMAKIYGSGLAFGAGDTTSGVLGAIGGGLGIARNFFSGLGAGKENKRGEKEMMRSLYGENPNYQYGQTGSNATYVFQEGGKITNADMMTGAYTTDMPQANLEVERGEYLKNSQTGAITEAVGKTHEEGGVQVNLPDNSKVLSDFTEIGKENAKKFQKQFDIAFKASHTFADVMDKVNNKIGLNKLIEEEKEYSEKIEKQLKSSIDEATKKVNLNFLAKEMEKLEKKKQMLKPIQDRVFEDVFREQEKIPKSSDGYTLLKQEGGDVQPSPEEIISAFSEMTGQDPQEIIAQLQQMQPEEQSQALQQMMSALQQAPQEEQMSNPQEEQQMPMAQEGKLTQAEKNSRFEDFYKQSVNLGYTGKKQIGEMQTWMAKNYPNEVASYFTKSGQPMTAKHVDIVKSKYKDAFNKAGIPSDKPSAQYTQEEKNKLKEVLGEKADTTFWTEGFQDNKWDWRFPVIQDVIGTPIVPKSGLDRMTPIEPLRVPITSTEEVTLEEQTPTVEEEQAKKNRMVTKTVMPQIPSNFILPPDSLRGVYNADYTASRLDPIKVSAEANLAAIEGQRQATADSLAFLPESQRAALLANMQGTAQASANQAISQATQANTSSQYQADVYNASQADKEQLMNINLDKDYEAKMLAGIRNTDIDLRSYYDQLNREQRQKFLDVSTLNMLNQTTPNYQSTGADIFFNNAPLNVSNAQVDPYLDYMYKATEGNPQARMKFLAERSKSKQA